MKMIWARQEDLGKHYSDKEDYLISLGKKTLKTYEEYGKDAGKDLGTTDPLALGKLVRRWTIDYVGSGPVVAILLEGRHAVDNVRSIAGPTMPVAAPSGTIRGDLATDSAAYANAEKRVWKILSMFQEASKKQNSKKNSGSTKRKSTNIKELKSFFKLYT